MSKVFNRSIQLSGQKRIINDITIRVLSYDRDGNVLLCSGTTIPTDTNSGYAKGATFIDTDAVTGLEGSYVNRGTSTSCLFTNAVGYVAGAGGAVTQATSITTTVTLSKLSGTITTVAATLAAGVDATFTVTNTEVDATDVVVASIKSYGGTADGIPVVNVIATASGSFKLNIRNTGAVALDAIILVNFAVIKAVAA